MIDRATNPEYLRYQYGDAEKLRVRIEVHERFSENREDFYSWMVSHLEAGPSQTVLDVGCGAGAYHPVLARQGVRIVGVDASLGMLHDARRRARAEELCIPVLQAHAEALPVLDGTCDRVMANHMLYHVPDQVRALREMRRVLRPGGRVLLATNASDHMAWLHELHCQAAEALGFTPTPRVVNCFTLDDLPLVRSVFPAAERRILPNAFVFPSADGALRHYASGMIDAIRELPPDNSHRPKLLQLVEARIETIIKQEGVFRVPKDAGCFVANA